MFLESSPLTSWNREMKSPQVHHTAYIHPTAVLIGDVRVGENVFICPYVVLRADEGAPIIIGHGSNIQDGVIMHCLKGGFIVIGEKCSIAHGAVIHGPCVIGRNSFVGFRAVVHNAHLGSNCFISHCALVTNVELADDILVPEGRLIQTLQDADSLQNTSTKDMDFKRDVLSVNQELLRGYEESAEGELRVV